MIEFGVDEVDVSRIRAKLLLFENQVPNVIKKALNATARDAKTALADKARETYAVKSPRFKKAIRQKNATASNLVATLKITGKATALSDFKYRRHSGGASARGKLYKDGALKDLSLNDKLKAFVVKYHLEETLPAGIRKAYQRGEEPVGTQLSLRSFTVLQFLG